MVKKKHTHPTTATSTTEESLVTMTLEQENDFAELRSNLAEINKIQGVKGYILRNSTKAVIDLHDTEQLVAYALLTSETVDCVQTISKLFNLKTTHAVMEGKEMKMLCMLLGENTVSVFVEKNVNHTEIFRRISP